MSKHTPGPWKVGQYLGSLSSFHVHMDAGDKGRGIDVVEAVAGITTEQRLANARLIAAAPELLETLSKTLKTIEEALAYGYLPAGTEQELEAQASEIRSAIAKATGEA